MGFWSNIGKVLSVGGGLAAAPFTGGASLLPTILEGAGAVVGGMGNAATANRGEQDRTNLTRDQIGLSAANSFENALQNRARLEIDQRQEGRDAEKAAYLNALKSALAMNMQDAHFDRSGFKTNVPNISFSGGARPSAIGAQGREAAALLNNSSLQKLMAPQPTTELPAAERYQMHEPSKASFWEKLAGPLGMGLTIAGKVAGMKSDDDSGSSGGGGNFMGSAPYGGLFG